MARMRWTTSWLAAALSLVAACETGTTVSPDGGQNDGAYDVADADADGILDDHEDAQTRVDTDMDGTPDYLDLDSDDDGFADADEAGDRDVSTAPVDSDGDGIPDFLDIDSDGNGIPDADELAVDTDGDGVPDRADLDDDNDGVTDTRELMGITDPLVDSDADGVPNLRDPDSDNDLILDGDEFRGDSDGDGLFDWEDLDSDNDGISDTDEAGDRDLRSVPINSDASTGDSVPDFLDPDSDNDGLPDRIERERGTSTTRADSDDDGVSDLIEVAAGTNPLDADENPRTRGDFVFIVPHAQEPEPPRDTLEFRTNVQFADIYFLFDESGSMDVEIDALRTAVTMLVDDLTCRDSGRACMRDSGCPAGEICSTFSGTCIEDPGRSACLLSPWTGVGKYEVDYDNLLSLQPNPMATALALSFPTPGGTENLFEAVWGVADPIAAPGIENGCAPAMPGFIGCPAFREDAVRILVTFTDENSDDGRSARDVGAALRDAGITFIGVWSDATTSTEREHLVEIARESGSVDRFGNPLVFDGMDAGVVPVVTSAITEIVEGVPLRVTITATDEGDDSGDALQFIDYLEVNTSGGRCSALATTEDTDGNGYNDAFPSVRPGTPVCWDVVPARNDAVEPTPEPQVFRARLTVSGDGSPLDARTVYFLVPPYIPPPMID